MVKVKITLSEKEIPKCRAAEIRNTHKAASIKVTIVGRISHLFSIFHKKINLRDVSESYCTGFSLQVPMSG